MNYNIIATTTNTIENAEIVKYIDLISTNVVVGTNIFSDLGASITDFFGGFSDTYQNKLQKIYEVAIYNLKSKATNIGANAIVGLKIDFDEISGKGKSMFMISALGTAVVIKSNTNTKKNIGDLPSIDKHSVISKDKLEEEIIKKNIITNLKENILPKQENWVYLMNNKDEEITRLILLKYLNIDTELLFSDEYKQLTSNIFSYFKSIDIDKAVKVLYDVLEKNHFTVGKITDIVEACNLFDPSVIIELIEKKMLHLAIPSLSADMNSYSNIDLQQMEKIVNMISSLPETGRIENIKGVLGKAKDVYICPNGHNNFINNKFCTNCDLNIKGLSSNDIKLIESFKLKVETLSAIMSEV